MSAYTVTETHAIPIPSISMTFTYDDASTYTDTETHAIPVTSILATWIWGNAIFSVTESAHETPIPSISISITSEGAITTGNPWYQYAQQ